MHIQTNVSLAPHTSFRLGGMAEHFVEVSTSEELIEVLQNNVFSPVWLIGYGSNTLISDEGLPGLVICMRGGDITVNDTQIIADAGTWWDDVVQTSINNDLWGIELMSEIPGSVGAAAYINITAYGQSFGSRVAWVDTWDQAAGKMKRLERSDLQWDYKSSVFQKPKNKGLIIIRVCLELSKTSTGTITYQKALDVAKELGLDQTILKERRDIVIEARHRAGSIWKPDDGSASKTVGSFFRNPVVAAEQADKIIEHEEHGKTKDEIKRQNKVHGGNEQRVSAAHVMLAAGFTRGQSWGNIKLNDQNLLKIEVINGATAQDVYDVAMHIQKTVKEKLGITLRPEARILGTFKTD